MKVNNLGFRYLEETGSQENFGRAGRLRRAGRYLIPGGRRKTELEDIEQDAYESHRTSSGERNSIESTEKVGNAVASTKGKTRAAMDNAKEDIATAGTNAGVSLINKGTDKLIKGINYIGDNPGKIAAGIGAAGILSYGTYKIKKARDKKKAQEEINRTDPNKYYLVRNGKLDGDKSGYETAEEAKNHISRGDQSVRRGVGIPSKNFSRNQNKPLINLLIKREEL